VTISVLVATRNRAEPLLRCLESVAAQKPAPHEVIVLDDASDAVDVAAVVVRARLPGVRVIRSDAPLGVAAGRNRMSREATGDVLLVLDDDAALEGTRCLAELDQALQAHPTAGIIALRIVDHRSGAEHILAPFRAHDLRRDPGIVDRPQLVAYFLGGAHAMRKTVYDATGGYHEHFVFGEEELDISYRAIQAGHEIFYAPNVVVHHYPAPSVLRVTGQRHPELFYHMRNRVFLARRYLPATHVVPYLAIWLARYGVAALRRPLGAGPREAGDLSDLFGGMLSAWRHRHEHPRTPLHGRALRYIRNHHGRLWF